MFVTIDPGPRADQRVVRIRGDPALLGQTRVRKETNHAHNRAMQTALPT